MRRSLASSVASGSVFMKIARSWVKTSAECMKSGASVDQGITAVLNCDRCFAVSPVYAGTGFKDASLAMSLSSVISYCRTSSAVANFDEAASGSSTSPV